MNSFVAISRNAYVHESVYSIEEHANCFNRLEQYKMLMKAN